MGAKANNFLLETTVGPKLYSMHGTITRTTTYINSKAASYNFSLNDWLRLLIFKQGHLENLSLYFYQVFFVVDWVYL